MIAEVSAALRGLYGPLLPGGISLRFGPPSADLDGALCFFLAAIEEDTHAVPADWADVRNEQGRVVGRRPPIRRFDLLYLVTAWSRRQERPEEALLDAVLAATTPTLRLDPGLLGGDLAGTDSPVLVRLAPHAERAYAALRLPPHTVLGLTVNAPLIPPVSTDVAAPAGQITLDVERTAPATGRDPSANRDPAADRDQPSNRNPAGHRRWPQSRIDERPPPPPQPSPSSASAPSSAPSERPVPAGAAPPHQRTGKENHAGRGEAR